MKKLLIPLLVTVFVSLVPAYDGSVAVAQANEPAANVIFFYGFSGDDVPFLFDEQNLPVTSYSYVFLDPVLLTFHYDEISHAPIRKGNRLTCDVITVYIDASLEIERVWPAGTVNEFSVTGNEITFKLNEARTPDIAEITVFDRNTGEKRIMRLRFNKE
jgi:hypothetical protein